MAKLQNAGGADVGPTDAALRAGLADSTANADKITRSTNYKSKDTAQYPLTISDYAMVPTCGLSTGKVNAIRTFLSRVTTSQTIGLQPGRLAPGNVQLTSAQLRQTKAAAAALSTKSCAKAHHAGHPTPVSHPSSHTGGSGGGSGTGITSTSGFGNGAGSNSGSSPGATAIPSGNTGGKSSTPASAAASATPAAFGIKHSDSGAEPGLILPIALAAAALLLVGGPGTLLLLNTAAGAALTRRIRRGVHR